jgi:hypothetical protein
MMVGLTVLAVLTCIAISEVRKSLGEQFEGEE